MDVELTEIEIKCLRECAAYDAIDTPPLAMPADVHEKLLSDGLILKDCWRSEFGSRRRAIRWKRTPEGERVLREQSKTGGPDEH